MTSEVSELTTKLFLVAKVMHCEQNIAFASMWAE